MEAINRGASSFLVKTDSIETNLQKFHSILAKNQRLQDRGYQFDAPQIICNTQK